MHVIYPVIPGLTGDLIEHRIWRIRQPAIQANLCERELKARTAWLVPVGPRIVRHFDLSYRVARLKTP